MKYLTKKVGLLFSAVVLLTVVATTSDTLGQGRGNGHGKGGGKGENRGGERRHSGENGRFHKFERGNDKQIRAVEMQRNGPRAQHQQRQQYDQQRQYQRQQFEYVRQVQRQQYEQQRQYQRQQMEQARRQERQQRQQYEQQRRYQTTEPYGRAPQWSVERYDRRQGDRDDHRRRAERYDRDQRMRWPRNVIINSYPQTYFGGRNSFGGYRNYGQYRSAQVHRRNEMRKANRHDRGFGYYQYAPTNIQLRNDWEYLRDNFLRSVIANAFQTDSYYVPTYNTVTVFQHANYSYNRHNGYNGYNAYDPIYPYNVQNGSYAGDYRVSPLYVDGPNYIDQRNAIGEMIGSIAIPLLEDSPVGGFVSRIFSEMMANGFDEGYYAGQYARSQGYDDRPFYDPYDPYVYDNVSFGNLDYNPYSCLAENRRYLSAGYELGYRDGLNERNSQFADRDSGSADLVSVLLGNIL